MVHKAVNEVSKADAELLLNQGRSQGRLCVLGKNKPRSGNIKSI